MHCFHVYLSGKKCPAAFVELRLTSTFMCVVVSSPSLSSLLLSGFLNFLSKLLSNHVRCSLLIFPINEPFFRRLLHCQSLLQHIGICLAKCHTSQIRSFKFASSSSDSLPQSVNREFWKSKSYMPVLGIVRLCNLYNKSSTWVCLSAHVSPDLWSCYECTMAIVYHKKPQKVIVIPCKTVMRWQRKGQVVLVCMYYGQVLLRVLHSWIWWSILNVHTPHEQFSNSVR